MRSFKHGSAAWKYLRFGALALGSALLMPQLSSCNLVVDTSTEQCESDSDCSAKGGAFTGTLCTEQKVCERLVCSSSAECSTRLGEAAVCRPSDNSCAKLRTDDCTEIFPEDALMEGETIVLGFMGPLRDQFASVGIPLRQGAELALNEIETRTNGLPAAGGSSQQRHLVMLGCHDIDNPEAVAKHLVDNVQVPAILGPAFSGITVQVTTDVTVPANVMTISASATSPDITSLNDKGLVWRTAPSDTIQAIPLAELVLKVEEILRNDGKLGVGESARIAIAAKDDAYGLGLADAVFAQMQAQGVGAASDSKLLLRRDYADPADNENVDWETPASEIVSFHPHVIFGLGTNEFVTELLTRVESKWDTADRPKYLLPEGGKVDELEGIVAAQPDLSARILGTVPGAQLAPGYSGFAQRFSAFFNEPPGTFSEFAYDAAYLLAYAIAITGQAHPNGTQMAEAMKHMTCSDKTLVPAGPTNFSGLFQNAATNQCIDFDGVSGPLDFNNDTGEASSDIAIWCPERSGSNVSLSAQAEYYSAAEGAIQGTVTFCP
ncbi:MAG: ABC transporter substrate-binding protein [Polyangiaceae bacterium]|nr:ABC transporter substrate-binding protein [Myxococcales bacterium]MCB9588622.1 ABC transporter substrate-binding protein [Polyangiaceae bacterium]